ncbi:hypothetical protein Cantr_03485 [Candida viswanathii]|uniref:Uncharacterized protein n=1 Tax=Candida viswanathii TaxID=5486 RepID=A0A367YMS9_9ASCO|nr:hypothetical protein Cantr_03485 [Candida viswanathii]
MQNAGFINRHGFLKLTFKEINQKRKKATTKKKRKLVQAPAEPASSPKQETPHPIEREPQSTPSENDELTEEQLDFKLSELGHYDSALSKSDKARTLQFLLQQQVKNTKYKTWLEQEAPLYRDPAKQSMTVELITDIEHTSDEVCLILRVYIKELIKHGRSRTMKTGSWCLKPKRTRETTIQAPEPQAKPEHVDFPSDNHIPPPAKRVQQANESYMKLSIGNVCWPSVLSTWASTLGVHR